jgi:hypothetical protein
MDVAGGIATMTAPRPALQIRRAPFASAIVTFRQQFLNIL